jgi:hypothetical protein
MYVNVHTETNTHIQICIYTQVSTLPKIVEKAVTEGNQREKAILESLGGITSASAYIEAVEGYLRELEQYGHEEQANVRHLCIYACMYVYVYAWHNERKCVY